ncbi:ribose 5-phosphate isomerase [Ignicoccus pacificus DSM 13166]|uniref:Ribose 5-phosphate isomerase A n=1 Tax=Ignicoccus pacificus DSM 13166 TaxID=940294 RepID=A0A977KAZ8_9CREN|nr:ribose 5-phosphate isomerase [Ignicoccus pacificus DSM 13166]
MGKREAAKMAVKRIQELQPEILGVGSGTTVRLFIEELSKIGFKGLTVSTSYDTSLLLASKGFKVIEIETVEKVDVSVDGADEVSKDLYLIKGGGAALLREKVLAELSRYRIYIVDESKVVEKPCGRKFPIPIEVVPAAYNSVIKKLNEMEIRWKLREAKGKLGPVITDNGNFILDLECEDAFSKIEEVKGLNGVASVGVFPPSLVDEVIIGGRKVLRRG